MQLALGMVRTVRRWRCAGVRMGNESKLVGSGGGGGGRRRPGFGGVLAVAAGLWWLPSRAWGSTDHVPGSGPPGWHVFFGLRRLTK